MSTTTLLFASQNMTAGELNAVIKKLGGEDGARRLLRDEVEVREVEHIVDLDAKPLIPFSDWRVEEHKPGGKFKWNPDQVVFHLSPSQQDGKTIQGEKLLAEVATLSPYNANLLDYLLDRPHLIPESWKQDEKGQTRFIYFWGTIYRDSGGNLFVRCPHWHGGRWQAGYGWLGVGWDGRRPAAVPPSKA